MKIYLDYIFLDNFLMALVILLEVNYLTRIKTNRIKLILGATISSIYVCIMLILKLPELDYFISKLLLNIFTIYIVFNSESIAKHLKILAIFYTVTAINIGANIFISQMFNIPVNSLKNKFIVYIFGISISYFIFKWLWKLFKNTVVEKDSLYKVLVNIGDKEFKYNGFLDTGNSLKDVITNKYVFFAKEKESILELIEKEKAIDIDINTVVSKSKKMGVISKNISVDIGGKKYEGEAVIVFDNNGLFDNKRYDMIINQEFINEKGGIGI